MEFEERHKLSGQIYPAEGWKNIKDIFSTSFLRRDYINIYKLANEHTTYRTK